MFDQNYKPWVRDKNYFFVIYNLQENETILHLIARSMFRYCIQHIWRREKKPSFISFKLGKYGIV